MAFVVFAVAAIAWALSLLRWAVAKRGRGTTLMWVLATVAAVAGAISVAGDVRSIAGVVRAPDADVQIRIIRRPTWWQLDYARRGVAFTTANELHIPAHERVRLSWVGIRVPSSESMIVADRPSVTRIENLRVIADVPDEFDRWFANEARPASAAEAQGFLFRNAGCGYCHVVRGVSNEAFFVAPDLTHFSSRTTIAATRYLNDKGMLSGWVVHSRGLKSRSEMPGNPLAPNDLHAVVAFLESLR
ncbi:MAG TPA: c-type cytochrome [Thermoanaerobaculia bacterium]